VLRIAQPSFQTTHNPLKLSKSRRNSSRSKRTTRTSLKWVRAKRPNLNDAAVHEIVQYILWVTILLSPYMGDGATRFARIVEAAPLYSSSSRLSSRTRGKAGRLVRRKARSCYPFCGGPRLREDDGLSFLEQRNAVTGFFSWLSSLDGSRRVRLSSTRSRK
jgi:hypothetical protein